MRSLDSKTVDVIGHNEHLKFMLTPQEKSISWYTGGYL